MKAKKTLALLIAAAMLTASMSTALNASAAAAPTDSAAIVTAVSGDGDVLVYGDFEYEVDGDEVTITKYTQSSTEFTVPSEIDGKPVTKIGESAFKKTNVRTIALPDTVTEIGGSAFVDCASLTEITLSKGLTTMGSSVFSGCGNLHEITIPKTLTKSSSYFTGSFNYCTGLQKATFEDGTTTIPPYIFENCENLTEVNIPDSVTLLRALLSRILSRRSATTLSANARALRGLLSRRSLQLWAAAFSTTAIAFTRSLSRKRLQSQAPTPPARSTTAQVFKRQHLKTAQQRFRLIFLRTAKTLHRSSKGNI